MILPEVEDTANEDDSCSFVIFLRTGDGAVVSDFELDPSGLPFLCLVLLCFLFFGGSSLRGDPRKGLDRADEAAALLLRPNTGDPEEDDNPRKTLLEVMPDGSTGRDEVIRG